MIKCIKNDGFAQVKGNEDKIVKALLNNEYYDEWGVHTTGEYISFDLRRKHEGITFDNYPDIYFKIKDTGEISTLMNMSPSNEVYCATTFFPNSKNESMDMIMNAPNFIRLDMDHEKYGVTTKLTLKEKTCMLFPGDVLLFNQAKELTHVLPNPTISVLNNNGFYEVDSNEIHKKYKYISYNKRNINDI